MLKYLFAFVYICFLLPVAAQVVTQPAENILPYSNYYTVRGGVNNSLSVINKKKSATVAFLGGSITFNPGWRDKVSNYLKERFPKTKFRFIQAGIPLIR
jgi:sialidase-1